MIRRLLGKLYVQVLIGVAAGVAILRWVGARLARIGDAHASLLH
ncbi:hypothetical protein AB4120_05735 [Cupriavidus sp. 2KB_3]|nr:hypothetical protein [Cupriavidus campinensis]